MFFFVSSGFKSQTVIVFSETNLEPLPNVQVISEKTGISIQTDQKGRFDLSSFIPGDVITFKHQSFVITTIEQEVIVERGYKIYLLEKVIEIGEVVISANKWEQDKAEIPNEILTITPRLIGFSNSQTSADLLEHSGQIFVQRSQLGGGSPMIRGFAANSVFDCIGWHSDEQCYFQKRKPAGYNPN
ncbi:MAG: hypothetical protein O2887_07150 [Bacteroidetes bacterium]|nr:hypothetical protein [Bacteroidota bacterium]MDA1120257.1 hypothetical protein [Bacteroidota bacterium]